jgi:hypothetical protein
MGSLRQDAGTEDGPVGIGDSACEDWQAIAGFAAYHPGS